MTTFNSSKILESIKEVIKKEIKLFEDSLKLRESSITGKLFINNNRGCIPKQEMRSDINNLLGKFVYNTLGVSLISDFERQISLLNKDTEAEGLSLVLKPNAYYDVDALEYLDKLAKFVNFDDNYFKKLIVHRLVFEKLNFKNWFFSNKIDANEISESIKKVKFNSFTISCLSDSDPKLEMFSVNQNALSGFMNILARLCVVYLGDWNYEKEFLAFEKLDAFDKENTQIEYKGITLTAQKNGKIKVTLDKQLAKTLEEEITPFLEDFKLYFLV